jgi:hypothetical protein
MEVEYSTTVTANTTEQIFSTLQTVVVTEPYVDVPLVVTLGEFICFQMKKKKKNDYYSLINSKYFSKGIAVALLIILSMGSLYTCWPWITAKCRALKTRIQVFIVFFLNFLFFIFIFTSLSYLCRIRVSHCLPLILIILE